jgi:hypothetical protein
MEAVTVDVAVRRRHDEPETSLRRATGPKHLTVFHRRGQPGAGIYALVGEVGAEVGGAMRYEAFLEVGSP